MSSQKRQIVQYTPPNFSNDVCSKEYALEVSATISILELLPVLLNKPNICVCNKNLKNFFQTYNDIRFNGEQKFGPVMWKYMFVQKVISNKELQDVLLEKKYIFTSLIPLLCRIAGQILLHKSISSYPSWLRADGKHNIFYVKVGAVNATLVVYLNSNKVWVCDLYSAVLDKHQIDDKVFGPVIHDFVQ